MKFVGWLEEWERLLNIKSTESIDLLLRIYIHTFHCWPASSSFCFLANACFDRREVGTKIGDSSQEIASFPPDCEQWVEGYPAKVWLSALFLYIPHSFVALMSFWQAHFPTHWMEQHMGCGSTNKIKTGTFYDFGRTFKYSAKKVHPFQHQKCSNEICHFL